MDSFTLMPLPTRLQFINDLLKSNPESSWQLNFQGAPKQFGVYTVEIGMPVYRLSNGRTKSAQLEFIALHNKPEDFFTKDPDSIEALKVQHELLKKLADKADLLDYFKNPRHFQTEPLILDQYGYVVNGNRRLCVWRELLKEDREKYGKYAHIKVLILPPCTEKDKEELEDNLQLAPEIKAKYSWVNRAIRYKEKMERYNWAPKDIARENDLDKESIVSDYLDMLQHANKYLEDRGAKWQYSRVEEKEYGFAQLIRYRAKFKDIKKADIFTALCYKEFDEDQADNRLYQKIADIYKNIDDMISKIVEDNCPNTKIEDIKPSSVVIPNQGISTVELNTQKRSAAVSAEQAIRITNIINDPKNKERITSIVEDTIASNKCRDRQCKKEKQLFENVKGARDKLRLAYEHIIPESITEGVDDLLEEIIKYVESIKRTMANDQSRLR